MQRSAAGSGTSTRAARRQQPCTQMGDRGAGRGVRAGWLAGRGRALRAALQGAGTVASQAARRALRRQTQDHSPGMRARGPPTGACLSAACGEGAQPRKALPQVMRDQLCSSPARRGRPGNRACDRLFSAVCAACLQAGTGANVRASRPHAARLTRRGVRPPRCPPKPAGGPQRPAGPARRAAAGGVESRPTPLHTLSLPRRPHPNHTVPQCNAPVSTSWRCAASHQPSPVCPASSLA